MSTGKPSDTGPELEQGAAPDVPELPFDPFVFVENWHYTSDWSGRRQMALVLLVGAILSGLWGALLALIGVV